MRQTPAASVSIVIEPFPLRGCETGLPLVRAQTIPHAPQFPGSAATSTSQVFKLISTPVQPATAPAPGAAEVEAARGVCTARRGTTAVRVAEVATLSARTRTRWAYRCGCGLELPRIGGALTDTARSARSKCSDPGSAAFSPRALADSGRRGRDAEREVVASHTAAQESPSTRAGLGDLPGLSGAEQLGDVALALLLQRRLFLRQDHGLVGPLAGLDAEHA